MGWLERRREREIQEREAYEQAIAAEQKQRSEAEAERRAEAAERTRRMSEQRETMISLAREADRRGAREIVSRALAPSSPLSERIDQVCISFPKERFVLREKFLKGARGRLSGDEIVLAAHFSPRQTKKETGSQAPEQCLLVTNRGALVKSGPEWVYAQWKDLPHCQAPAGLSLETSDLFSSDIYYRFWSWAYCEPSIFKLFRQGQQPDPIYLAMMAVNLHFV